MYAIVRSFAMVLFGCACVYGLVAGEPVASAQTVCTAEPGCGADSAGLVACGKGDPRTQIPVWKPDVDMEGNLSSDPPQRDGQVVYIAIDHALADAPCDNEQLFSFARPTDIHDPAQGGLAVNVQGNAQPMNGGCRLRGYYRNQDVAGMHQGWVETYFGAAKPGVVSPGKHCLAQSVGR